jgi:hypothetical protein
MTDLIEEFGERWNRFWFTPADARACCWLRLAVGLVAALYLASLASGLNRWYANDGLLPPATVDRLAELTSGGETTARFSYLRAFPASPELAALHAAAIIAALAFAAGFFTRISGVLTVIAVLSYVHRTPAVVGHLEPLLSFLIIYLCIAPSGACLSLDRLLASRLKKPPPGEGATSPGQPFDKPSVAANLGLRLIQVHVALFYGMMGLTKLYGDAWWDGNAVWMLLAQTQSRPLDLTGLRQLGEGGEYLLNAWTHGIVYFELAFPVLIWNRFTRPVLLVLAPFAWLANVLATGLLLFGLAMTAASYAFAVRVPRAEPVTR